MNAIPPPLGIVCELTHRCPLQCPYCSNPLELARAGAELGTDAWLRVLDEAAALGVLHVHFSGGEPTARKDLPDLVRRASANGLYTNLITAGVLLDAAAIDRLKAAGIDHIQLSFQDVIAESADRIAGLAGAHERKLAVAKAIRQAGLPLTLNFVVHRHNAERVPEMLALAESLGAARTEIAHVQYYGWGLVNRAALLPSRAQLEFTLQVVQEARARLAEKMVIDYVVPDYYAQRPKACMGGWGRREMVITPTGKAMPCHAADSLLGFEFPSVTDTPLADIWSNAPAFRRFRGTDWMPEPCRSCDRREIDWGGCRCQAFAMTGDAARTDPACALSPDHALMLAVAEGRPEAAPAFVYRRIGHAPASVSAEPVPAEATV
ncbi:MAG: pyrroloquinoline quinone biosynthesis protein PqqE [Acidobacteriia bacterium]|nr:pyrroloquinoline quinone biosynthesis protein PqqE [Methyloceanibacter sp.]MCL6490359.1 pyrroloquinoline quinone biosynthesis protein PqqE [Terriglobia bacterium]